MRTYGQYCPIARASEILAERWTPIILRNLLLGSTSFTEIADGAPGLSHTLLTQRLRELEHAGVVERTPNPSGRGWRYRPTEAGRDLAGVMAALGTWGERWMELAPEHLDPGVVLHSWCSWYLDRARLPATRVVAQFAFPDQPRKGGLLWVIFDVDHAEVCQHHPGFEVDVYVQAESRALAEWHLGRLEWAEAIRTERIQVSGVRALTRALPTWNRRSEAARAGR
jgi:DNA-binding HxlR family transcriptional regulator